MASGGIVTLTPSEKDPFKIVQAIRQLVEGRSNATGTATLTANAASTTVTATACAAGSTVLLQPTTANAAAEIGNGTGYVSTVANGSFTITHANNAQADRSFRWVAIG
jgi:hypothetical protein